MTRKANTKVKGVFLRGTVYQARMTIPKDARYTLGLTEYTQSLNTSDLKIAEARGNIVIQGWKRLINTARGSQSPEREALLWKAELDKANKEGDLPDGYGGYHAHPSHYAFSDRLDQMEDIHGEKATHKFHAIVTGSSIPSDAFVAEFMSTRTVTSRSAQQEETRIGYAIKQFPIYPVDKQAVNKWALSLTQEAISSRGKPYAQGTAKSILNINGSYYQHLLDMGHLDPNLSNPFKETRIKSGGGKKAAEKPKRIAWEKHQVTHLVDACVNKADDDLLNITLLAAHSGARLEELATLLVQSIYLEAPLPFFRITESKSAAGLRDVPVHPFILPLLKSMVTQSTNEFLFSDLSLTGHGERGSAISKRFGKLKKKLGYGPTQVFHSFRHTAITLFEQSGVSENVAMDVVGHEKPNLTFGHYSGGTSMEQRHKAVCDGLNYSFHDTPVMSLTERR
jgi:integrase